MVIQNFIDLGVITEGGYPLIQLKWRDYRDEYYPSLWCLENGIEQIYSLLEASRGDERWNLKNIIPRKQLVNIWQETFCYKIDNWEAFAIKNATDFITFCDFDKNMQEIEKRLNHDIQSFLEAIEFPNAANAKVCITKINKVMWNKYPQENYVSFFMLFESNLSLPENIGLGLGAARGTGIVRKMQQQ
jgi:hypothetical protein